MHMCVPVLRHQTECSAFSEIATITPKKKKKKGVNKQVRREISPRGNADVGKISTVARFVRKHAYVRI
ncbi:hypothetical protein POVWA1_006580 [Plasmodium ovale wallikeri]|uniref:Uncharacterized protein n=1 Tax=Plasmodium ovale wallikeri TaxID=864142 RepID=A0A1A8YIF1_PLAOA|nr:hypothetical protein POVWA1_006580 [Plasmodium ovale wallikeri]